MEMIKEKSKAEQIQQEFAEFKLSKGKEANALLNSCLLYTSPSPRD